MQDVVLVSSATRANDRYESLVDMIDPNEFSVEFITSKFMHPTKRFRDLSKEQPEKLRCKVTYIDELGYESHSDAVVAVSETFLKRAARNAKPGIPMEKVVLGTDFRLFEQNVGEHAVPRNDREIWIGYVGTLGRSYDIEHVIDALAIHKKTGYGNLRFVVIGGGFLKERFEAYANPVPLYLLICYAVYRVMRAFNRGSTFDARQSTPALPLMLLMLPFAFERPCKRKVFVLLITISIVVQLAVNLVRMRSHGLLRAGTGENK